MKALLVGIVLIFFGFVSIAQTTLVPGDIAVIGFKTTGSGRDQVRLLATRNIECGTQFIVTDRNWNASTSAWQCSGSDAECAVVVTVTQEWLAGTVVQIDFDDPARPAPVTLRGIGAATDANGPAPWGTNYGLTSQGDNVTILQGTFAEPTFIFAARNSGTFASGGNCDNRNNTGLPTGLTLGSTAVDGLGSKERPHYNCPGGSVLTSGTRAALLSSICTPANWIEMTAAVWNGAFSSSCTFTVTDAVWGPPVTGSIGVTGASCGCLSGCNLTSVGGPNCSPAVGGDCTAGYQAMSVDISVPSGCTYSVIATMRSWPGCSASGADGNCAGCDRLKVDLPAGAKSFQFGPSNSTLNDSYTLTGPGTIRVSGGANRADEIIVYRILSSPCASCGTFVLPIELLDFTAKPQGGAVLLEWRTASETNNDYYTIERSGNGIDWVAIGTAGAVGNSSEVYQYHRFDNAPLAGISYYRLRQTDLDGKQSVSKVVAVNLGGISGIQSKVRVDQGMGWLEISAEYSVEVEIESYDLAGRIIFSNVLQVFEGHQSLPIDLGHGAYVVLIRAQEQVTTHKVILY